MIGISTVPVIFTYYLSYFLYPQWSAGTFSIVHTQSAFLSWWNIASIVAHAFRAQIEF